MPAVDLSHIAKYFGPVKAVDDVSFSLEKGELFGLLGPNGAGKTTCLRVMLDIFKPDSGSVALLGFLIRVVRADAAYWTNAILAFILYVLQAWPAVDYNLRRLGKKFIAPLDFLEWWRRERQKRADIERSLGILKRWYGLKAFYVQGLENVMRHALPSPDTA